MSFRPFVHLPRVLAGLSVLFCVGLQSLPGQVALTYDADGGLAQISSSFAIAPTVTAGPVNRLGSVGQSASFSVLSTGSAPLTYQWQLNSNSIPGAVTDSLRVANIAAADFGAYRVIVSNAFGSVTSSNAFLQLDSDGDGLADAWELTYLGSITNYTGLDDYDSDGIPNLAEFREGTLPKSFNSANPRLTIISDRGQVFVTPNLPYYTNGQTVSLLAVPDPGQEFLGFLGAGIFSSFYNLTTNPASLKLADSQMVRAIFGLSLTNSLDVTNRWRIDQAGWYGQTNITHDGVDAAQSARTFFASEQAVLELTNVMSGEGTVSFWWKVDGTPRDSLVFYVNNSQRSGAIGTNTDWQLRTYYLPAGTNRIRWIYQKGGNEVSEYIGTTNAPADAGWVDEVKFEVWTDPLKDTDGDGLADLWEWKYFDSLDAKPGDDPDRDGISNLDEYLDGTDPTSSGSQKPRLTLLSEGAGTVSANPSKLKYNYSEVVTNSAVPALSNFFVMWTGDTFDTNTTTKVTMSGSRTIKGVFGFALDQALETSGLPWTRGGAAGWYGQTNVSHDGVDAAQSAPIYSGLETWMETTVTGPGGLSFFWKVSSLTNANTLRLNLNGIEQPYRISGEVDWQPQFFFLGPGTNTFRWRFFRNNYSTNFTDAGWVDQVAFTPGNIAPAILSQPTDRAVLQGTNVTLTAFAVGTPTLMYEWLRNGVVISPASTNASYTITNISPAQGGSGYSVRVSNAAAATNGTPFAITVLPVPPLNDAFSNRILFPGFTNMVSGYNFGATRETGEPDHASVAGSRSVWWSWIAPRNGEFRLHGSSQGISSLLLAIYTGNSLNTLAPVGSAQAYGVFSNSTYFAEADALFSAVSNTVYAFAVDSGSGDAGWIQLAVTYVPPPPNDQFANRILLQGSTVTGLGYNVGATAEPGEPDHTGFSGATNSVWWAWSPPVSGTVRLNAQGTTFSPVIAIYTGAAVSALSPVASTFFATQLDFTAVGGVPYAIAFDGFGGGIGDIRFTMGMLAPVIDPPRFSPDGSIQMTVTGLPGSSYVLEMSTDLTVWLPLSTNTPPPSGLITFTNYPAIDAPSRFYRIMMQ